MHADAVALEAFGSSCRVVVAGRELGTLRLSVPGRHNLLNALSAVAVGLELGLRFEAIAAALAEFRGAERRFQLLGEAEGVLVVDDYGHHPTEIAAVIAAARAGLERRLIVVFQPHRYTRTERLLPEFGETLAQADVVVLCDIYPAGEDPIPGVTVDAVAAAIEAAGGPAPVIVRAIDDVPAAVGGAGRARRSRDHARRRLDRHRRAEGARRPRGSRRQPRRGPLMAVKAPADKRFKRGRVKTPRKAARRWTALIRPLVKWTLVLGILGYTTGAGAGPGHRVAGAAHQPRRRAGPAPPQCRRRPGRACGCSRATNIVRADLDAARRRLLGSPWIADATLRRHLPATIEIAIEERQPVALARFARGGLQLIAEDGMVLGPVGAAQAGFDLPIADGLTPVPGRSLSGPGVGVGIPARVDPERAGLIGRLVESLRQDDGLLALRLGSRRHRRRGRRRAARRRSGPRPPGPRGLRAPRARLSRPGADGAAARRRHRFRGRALRRARLRQTRARPPGARRTAVRTEGDRQW